MDNRDNKSPPPLPPSSSRFVKSEQQASLSASSSFSHDDISGMPENPPKNRGHRRAHSEIITLPDDLTFDVDLPDDNDLLSIYLQFDQLDSSPLPLPPPPQHNSIANNNNNNNNKNNNNNNERPTRVRHQHSLSMDGSIHPDMLLSATAAAADDVSGGGIDTKKAMSADKLAELALVDPKRAKRYPTAV